MKAFPSRPIQIATALSLAVMTQANLLMASFSPCGLPFGHAHYGIGHIDPVALKAHLAAEATCRTGASPGQEHSAVTGAYGRVVSEPRGESLAHTLNNLSVLIGFAALVCIVLLLVIGDLSSRLKQHRIAVSPYEWRPPDPPPRHTLQSVELS